MEKNSGDELGIVFRPVEFGRWEQEVQDFKVSLRYIVKASYKRPYLKNIPQMKSHIKVLSARPLYYGDFSKRCLKLT